MGKVECIDNAWLLVDDGIIVDFGPVSDSPLPQADKMIDAEGGYVMPTFCDSHSHVVYAGCRDGEFRDKIAGLSYEEIAARGGGILNSADLLHSTSEDELFRQSIQRVQEVMAKGTGALEIKSGYGLTTEDELKMLLADKTRPMRQRIIAKGVLDKKGLDVLERIIDRAYGKVQHIDLTSKGEQIKQDPLQVHVVTNNEEYQKILAEIQKEQEKKDAELDRTAE